MGSGVRHTPRRTRRRDADGTGGDCTGTVGVLVGRGAGTCTAAILAAGVGGLAPAPTVPSRAAARHPNVGRRDDGAESLMLSVSNPICQGYQNQRRHQQQEPFNRQALVDVENVIQRCAGMRAQR